MRSQLLHDGHLVLDLSREEHNAVSGAVSAVMAALEPCQIEDVLDLDVDAAYEIQYSIYLCESAARLTGVRWLPPGEFDDEITVSMGIRPNLDIRFDGDGSAWRLDHAQLRFVETCIAFHSGSSLVGTRSISMVV
jgi:hypothetical protein